MTSPGSGSASLGDELVAQRRGVRLEPALGGLAVLHAEDLDPGGRDLATGCREPHELASMGAPVRAADHDAVAVDEHVLERGVEVREGSAKGRDRLAVLAGTDDPDVEGV